MSPSSAFAVITGKVVREPRFYENEKSNSLHFSVLIQDMNSGNVRKSFIDVVAYGWLADQKKDDVSAQEDVTVSGKLESYKRKDKDYYTLRVVARDIVIDRPVEASVVSSNGESESDDAPF